MTDMIYEVVAYYRKCGLMLILNLPETGGLLPTLAYFL